MMADAEAVGEPARLKCKNTVGSSHTACYIFNKEEQGNVRRGTSCQRVS